jgi:Polyglycine hydrolase-like, structural repeat
LWSSGLTVDQFKQKDAELFNQGFRLVIVDKYDTDEGRHFLGVWRPGTGAQQWWAGLFKDFKATDQQHLNEGLRIVAMNHSYGMMAAWRPGTGDQFWLYASVDNFKTADQQHFNAGRRLIHLGVGFE